MVEKGNRINPLNTTWPILYFFHVRDLQPVEPASPWWSFFTTNVPTRMGEDNSGLQPVKLHFSLNSYAAAWSLVYKVKHARELSA